MTYQEAEVNLGRTVRIKYKSVRGPMDRTGVIIAATTKQLILALLVDDNEDDTELRIKLKDINEIKNLI